LISPPACGAIALASTASSAWAQPAAAVGKPLPDGSLRDGTVAVRVIAGDRSKPVTGADVTLTLTPPDGVSPPVTQVARTDAEGRAQFADVPENVQVRLSVAGSDGKDIVSSPFPQPQTGGVRVLLSTVSMAGGDGPMMGPNGQMSPRRASGTPRPEQADDRDQITVRISYDDFADTGPLGGVKIALVG
jgi:hypothetical protein